jgi:FKBP-type peptidyl-prolyl cis-trans isomerase FkpA
MENGKLKMKGTYLGLVILLIVMSCTQGNEKRTASGMRYILHEHKDGGKRPVKGDYVTVRMLYTDANDSILHDSRVKPVRFQLRQSPFAGSMEEGLMELSEGDSATLFVSADSLYDKVLSKEPGNTMAKPKPGSFLKFHVRLARVQNYNDAELEMALNESHMIEAEEKALQNYLKEKNITSTGEPEGYIILKQTEGRGEPITDGTTVQVNFTGRFLNGMVFDSNTKGKPYTFTIGNNEVIAGWELAFRKLKQGDKATLIIPSKLGYGKEGLLRPNSSAYVVPPFSTLVFDVEVVQARPTKNS